MGVEGGGAGAPDLPLENYKLSFISKKKNWCELPSRSEPPPPPPPVGVVWIRTRMSDGGILFFYLPFLHVTGLAIILYSADAQAYLRHCCLHATKSSFSQQGTYGMG